MKEKIDAASDALGEELSKWEALGIDPANFVQFNLLVMDAYLTTAVALLVEKGILDDPELILAFKKRMIGNLEMHRANAEEIVRAANMEAIRRGQPLRAVPKEKLH